jgi:hypothetical protein
MVVPKDRLYSNLKKEIALPEYIDIFCVRNTSVIIICYTSKHGTPVY